MLSRSAIVAMLVLAAGCTRQSPAPEQADATAAAPAPAQPAGAVDRSHAGAIFPAAKLVDLDGKPVTLPRDRPVLANLWATWCAPCVAEMPTLDRAAAALDGSVAVVAINQGDEADKVRAFLAAKPLGYVRPVLDRQLSVSIGLEANLPTTILYGRDGREIWRITGGRDWTSASSQKLLAEAG